MAKSLRSKFKRRIRAIARVKKVHKEDARLDAAVARRVQYEAEEAEKKIEEEKNAPDVAVAEGEMEVDSTKKPISMKKGKDEDGKYPGWMTRKERNKFVAKNKKKKKAPKRR